MFVLPFFIITCLKLRKRQMVALCGVFSLGLITIVISLARFLVYTVSDYGLDDAAGSKSRVKRLPSLTSLTSIRFVVHSRDVRSYDRSITPYP